MLGPTSSARIARMVKDVVTETQNGGLSEIRMSDAVLDATLAMRAFLFEAVYENEIATAEFKKATGILGGLWEKVRERPAEFLDAASSRAEGLDVAAQGLSGRHDRPLRGRAVRAAVHPEALDRADGLESAIIDGRLSRDFRERGTVMQLDLTRYRQPRQRTSAGRSSPTEVAQEGDAYRIVAPVDLEFDIHKDKDKFRLVGTARTELELPCSRCLEPFRLPVDAAFDLRYLPASELSAEDEREVEEEDLETSYYRDDQIDLNELLREQFYLALPMKPLCRDECPGSARSAART